MGCGLSHVHLELEQHRRQRIDHRGAEQVARAVLLGLLYVTFIKALTGREHPPPMNESLGFPCVSVGIDGERLPSPHDTPDCFLGRSRACDPTRVGAGAGEGECREPRLEALPDSSGWWWWKTGNVAVVVTGWPSGHTMSATALTTALVFNGAATEQQTTCCGGRCAHARLLPRSLPLHTTPCPLAGNREGLTTRCCWLGDPTVARLPSQVAWHG
jgi:hypothetical protein